MTDQIDKVPLSTTPTVVYGGLARRDVRELAALHRRAFPDFFMSTLGEPFLRQFYSGFLNDPTGIAVIARAESAIQSGSSWARWTRRASSPGCCDGDSWASPERRCSRPCATRPRPHGCCAPRVTGGPPTANAVGPC